MEKASLLISLNTITNGNPSSERLLGRMEGYLNAGFIIDQDDLASILSHHSYNLTDLKSLGKLAGDGIKTGTLLEPDDLPHLGLRTASFCLIADLCINMELESKSDSVV